MDQRLAEYAGRVTLEVPSPGGPIKKHGTDYLEGVFEIHINVDRLVRLLAAKAVRNKSGRSKQGFVQVTYVKPPKEPKHGTASGTAADG